LIQISSEFAELGEVDSAGILAVYTGKKTEDT
jgi:hypothetical protein